MDELLVKIDGFTITTTEGQVTLMTRGANITEYSKSKSKLLTNNI